MGRDGEDDGSLLRRVRAGDEDAYGVLFDRHAPTLAAYAARWLPGTVRRRFSVSDVLQEVRFDAFRRLPDFVSRGDASFRNWLLRFVELKVREAVRFHTGTKKRDAGQELSRPHRPASHLIPGDRPTPSEHAVAREARERLFDLVAALPADYGEVIRLTKFEHLTLGEAAVRLGRSYEAVKKLYGRALLALTEAWESTGEEE